MAELNDITRFGSPYILSDRGSHYYKTLIKQYMAGIPLKDDKLIKLFGLGVWGCNLEDTSVEMEEEVTNEIRKKLDIDMMEFSKNQTVKLWLYDNGYLIDNPDYDEDYSRAVLLRLKVNE